MTVDSTSTPGAPVATRPAGGLDALVAATPPSRDRVVDLLRAASICVVVLWHWSLSITHWNASGALTMPNPIGDVPGLWAATWVLQVMPVFFFVGGYANLAGWQATVRDGGGAARFLRGRMRRLLAPLVPWLGCWVVVDLAWQAAGGRSVTDWGMVVFVPLWFLGVYAGVVLAVPVTARLHRVWRGRALALMAAGVMAADVARMGLDVEGPLPGLAGSACAWLFCHQLGYFWRDGTLVAGGRARARVLMAAGLGALVALTTVGPYPPSMVAVRGEATSNMFPTTVCIAALATFQLGLMLHFRARLEAWLQGRRPWRAVVAANGVAMPVFCWHMTALVAFLGLYEWAGFTLADEPTAAWWLTRPLWVVGPGLLLAGVLFLLARSGGRKRPARAPAGSHRAPSCAPIGEVGR
jgi:fucose 4-O-acetylase-like acetyltransferase